MFKSLKAKIIASLILLAFICVLAFTAISVYEIQTTVTNQMRNDGANLATVINREIGKYVNDTDNVAVILKEIKEQSKNNIKYISLVDTNAKIIASSEEAAVSPGQGQAQETVDTVSSASAEGNNGTNAASGQNVQEGESSGYIFKTAAGDKVYNVSTPIYRNNKLVGTIGIGISLNVMNRMITQSLLQVILMSLAVLLMAVILGVIIAKNITTPITNVIDRLDDFSRGDFTVEFDSNRNDETKKLTDALNNSIAMLKEMLIETKVDMDKLGNISSYLKNSSQNISGSSRAVSQAIAEVAQGAGEQSRNINQVTEVLSNFNKSLDSVQDKVINTTNSTAAIENTADIGAEKLAGLVHSIEEVRVSFNNAAASIEHLNGDANKIGEIMNVINDVAQQTNLLALNAAIEAARAGEAGRGFAIVAEEIRKLAEKVMESSKSINTIVVNIISGVEGVANTTESISYKMDKQIDMIDNTRAAFKNIQAEVSKTTPQFKNISVSLKDIVSEEKRIVGSVQEVSQISGQIASSTQQVSTSLLEHTTTMEQLLSIADNIDEISVRLNKNIGRFKV